jgi:hypothetical protein
MRSGCGLGVSFLARRARSSWLLLACVAVTVLLATGLAAVLWTFAAAVIPSGAESFLADPQSRVIGLSGPASAGRAAADSQLIRATLRKAWPGAGFQLESALWAEPIQLPSISTSASATSRNETGNETATLSTTQVQIASLEGFSAQATLTAWQWPGLPHGGGPVPVALPATVASRLHLTLGSVLTGNPQPSGAPMSLRVTGLYRPDDPASPYWALDLLPVSGSNVQSSSVATAVMAWPALSVLTPDEARHRQGRQAWLAGIAWAGGDLAVVALAVVAVWELRGFSAVAHPATGSLGIDPVVAVAPALALAGVALIPLRGLPLLARLADKGDRLRTAAGCRHGELADRQAADPPGGPGPARRRRDGESGDEE